jgi:hypothetical protein
MDQDQEIQALKDEVYKLQRILVETDERARVAEARVTKFSTLLCQTICHLDHQRIPHGEISEGEMEQVPDRVDVLVNDPVLTFQHLHEANKDRFPLIFGCRLHEISLERCTLQVCSETGDLAKLVNRRVCGDAVSDLEILREAADVVIKVDLLVSRMGYELANAVSEQFDNVSDRAATIVRLERRDPSYLRSFLTVPADDRTTFNSVSPA